MEKKDETPKKELKNQKSGEYTSKDIFVLEGLDPVRKRPGMYIGSTGSEGLHHLIWEVLDNGIDEALGGYADEVKIELLPEGKVLCSDNGRGIPVDLHPQTKKSALETVMTTLHAGAKFGGKAYQVSGGLHGVGVSVVNALSTYVRVEVERDGNKYAQEYSIGNPTTKLMTIGKSKNTGTTVIFKADEDIFSEREFNYNKILKHLRQQAYLTKGLSIIFNDKRNKEDEKLYRFYFEGGIESYIDYLTRGSKPQHPNIFYCIGKKDDILVEAALRYTDEYEELEEGFANNIHTLDGGNHTTGFRSAMTRVLNDYARKNGYLKESEENLKGQDIREGLTAIVSIKIREPQFEGQTKAKLGNPEAKNAVESVVSEYLTDFLERSPGDAKAILEKCFLAAKARRAARLARETVIRKGVLEGMALPGKLADCSSKKPEESEIYIVEGESAGGCFSGDTKVALTDGRNLSFENLVKEHSQKKKNYCYTVNNEGLIEIAEIKNPRKTKTNTSVIKIILDNGEEIICTPDHRFMLVNGEYVEAKDLQLNNSLMPLNRKHSEKGGKITIDGYEMVYQPKTNYWNFTHILADKFNISKKIYSKIDKNHKHHIDNNKLNNNPDNIIQMTKEDHLEYHRKMASLNLHTKEAKDKARKVHQSAEHRKKISDIMSSPKMKALLSLRAKKQWENKDYKKFMTEKFLEFYKNNPEYRKENNKLLYKNQKEHWNDIKNREKQSKKVKEYFENHPELKKILSVKAKKQWENTKLLAWRKEETKKQWTQEFRKKRKESYNQTYKQKALKLMKEILESSGEINKEKYQKERLNKKDKSLLKYETICSRFFNNNDKKLEEAVANYNHKVKKIVFLKEKIDVYDIEVEGTHNFALSSGIFVHNSAKMGRNRRFQAILPLKGKILNVERARLDRVLSSQEIKHLIIALGTAIGQDFNIEKARYHRIIIMCDADSDGNHIRTLLLTLFYRHFKEIIERGYLYIAQPPLYKIKSGKKVDYAYNEGEKENILKNIEKDSKINIQRYKGLGEMNPEQLWETTMNPDNRVLLRVTIEDVEEADKMFDVLMGTEVEARKKFIQTHAKKVENLDI